MHYLVPIGPEDDNPTPTPTPGPTQPPPQGLYSILTILSY